GVVKVVAELLHPEERTIAVGVFASGTSIGAVITPPVAAYLIVHYGWQVAFVAVGLPGLLWIFAWRALYRPPPVNQEIQPNASQLQKLDKIRISSPERSRRWSFLLRQRVVWTLVLGRFIEEPAGWLFFSWLPLYLRRVHDVGLMNIGFLLTIPFFALD